jgi:hypothetical protein
MASNKIIDIETDKDAALNFTKDDLYDCTNDSALLIIVQRRVRRLEKQMDRLIALLQVKLSDPIDIKKAND